MNISINDKIELNFSIKNLILNLIVISLILYSSYMITQDILTVLTGKWNDNVQKYCGIDLYDTLRNFSEVNTCSFDSAPILRGLIYQSIMLHLVVIGFSLILKRSFQERHYFQEVQHEG